MKPTSSVLILLGFTMLGASYSTVRAQAPKSVLDGVYTEEQAKRGEKVYADSCATCHGPMLEGTPVAGPTLAGPDFTNDWKNMNLGALQDKVNNDMPFNAPGSLTPEQYSDVLAYLLRFNKYPDGKTELPIDPAAIKLIRMVEPPK
jgi:cytochrome c